MARLILFFLIFCINTSAVLPGKPIQVLFVGNSLTYTNDLPHQVEQIAKAKGVLLSTKTLAFPNYALEDHWNDGELQKLINSKKYAFVIVQQGPSSQQEGRTMLFEYGEKINNLCVENDTRLGFYMVWPAKINYATFDGVIKNHTDVANHFNALLYPVGEVWKKHFDTTNDFSYYGPDNFHPSVKGTQVAAEVITSILFAELGY